MADVADAIFEYALKKTVVVNLPAQAHRAVAKWIDTKGLLDLGKEHEVTFIKWFVSDGESDSIKLFTESLEHYQGYITHVFIKNWGRCDEWDYFKAHEEIQKAIAEYNVAVIDFPKLSDGRRIEINAKHLTFEDASNYSEFGLIGRNQIKTYLREAYKAFESTGLLAKAKQPQGLKA